MFWGRRHNSQRKQIDSHWLQVLYGKMHLKQSTYIPTTESVKCIRLYMILVHTIIKSPSKILLLPPSWRGLINDPQESRKKRLFILWICMFPLRKGLIWYPFMTSSFDTVVIIVLDEYIMTGCKTAISTCSYFVLVMMSNNNTNKTPERRF